MQDLGTLGGGESRAFGVSADGSVVVGWAENAAGQTRAFRWTAAGGMEDLNITYAHLLTNGSELRIAYAVSPDGRYIVGSGYNAATERFEAFLLDTQGTSVEERSGAARVRLRLLPQLVHERVVLELEAAEAVQGVRLMVSDVLGACGGGAAARSGAAAGGAPGGAGCARVGCGAVHGGAAHGGGQHCRAARGGAVRRGFALAEGSALEVCPPDGAWRSPV
jgi:probable HAF family extracellular repeat protein